MAAAGGYLHFLLQPGSLCCIQFMLLTTKAACNPTHSGHVAAEQPPRPAVGPHAPQHGAQLCGAPVLQGRSTKSRLGSALTGCWLGGENTVEAAAPAELPPDVSISTPDRPSAPLPSAPSVACPAGRHPSPLRLTAIIICRAPQGQEAGALEGHQATGYCAAGKTAAPATGCQTRQALPLPGHAAANLIQAVIKTLCESGSNRTKRLDPPCEAAPVGLPLCVRLRPPRRPPKSAPADAGRQLLARDTQLNQLAGRCMQGGLWQLPWPGAWKGVMQQATHQWQAGRSMQCSVQQPPQCLHSGMQQATHQRLPGRRMQWGVQQPLQHKRTWRAASHPEPPTSGWLGGTWPSRYSMAFAQEAESIHADRICPRDTCAPAGAGASWKGEGARQAHLSEQRMISCAWQCSRDACHGCINSRAVG